MPERLGCEVLQKVRYINTLIFTFTFQTQQTSCRAPLQGAATW